MESKDIRFHVQWTTALVGMLLIGFGVYNGVTTDDWTFWSVVASLGPIGGGTVLVLPGPVKRALDILAPKVPFLDAPEDDDD